MFTKDNLSNLILSFSKTWLDETVSNGMINVPGHQLFRKDRGGRGGGVAILCPDNISTKRRSDLEVDNLEAIWIETKLNRKKLVLICCVYRPPSASLSEFEEHLSSMLDPCLGVIPSSIWA